MANDQRSLSPDELKAQAARQRQQAARARRLARCIPSDEMAGRLSALAGELERDAASADRAAAQADRGPLQPRKVASTASASWRWKKGLPSRP